MPPKTFFPLARKAQMGLAVPLPANCHVYSGAHVVPTPDHALVDWTCMPNLLPNMLMPKFQPTTCPSRDLLGLNSNHARLPNTCQTWNLLLEPCNRPWRTAPCPNLLHRPPCAETFQPSHTLTPREDLGAFHCWQRLPLCLPGVKTYWAGHGQNAKPPRAMQAEEEERPPWEQRRRAALPCIQQTPA